MAAVPTGRDRVYINEAKEEQLGSFGLREAGKDSFKYKLTMHRVYQASVKQTNGKVTLNKMLITKTVERPEKNVII